MADSVPAPMVQVPAEPGSVISAKPPGRKKAFLMALCDDGEWWVRLDNYGSFSERGPFREVRVLFDAATHTPAASVPAADILALADQWATAAGMFDKRYGKQSRTSLVRAHVKQLRALVAAAEQADKGEACTDHPGFTCEEMEAAALKAWGPAYDIERARYEDGNRSWISEGRQFKDGFLAGFRAGREQEAK